MGVSHGRAAGSRREHGLDDAVLARALRRPRHAGTPRQAAPNPPRLFRQLASPDALTGCRSTFGAARSSKPSADAYPWKARNPETGQDQEQSLPEQVTTLMLHQSARSTTGPCSPPYDRDDR